MPALIAVCAADDEPGPGDWVGGAGAGAGAAREPARSGPGPGVGDVRGGHGRRRDDGCRLVDDGRLRGRLRQHGLLGGALGGGPLGGLPGTDEGGQLLLRGGHLGLESGLLGAAPAPAGRGRRPRRTAATSSSCCAWSWSSSASATAVRATTSALRACSCSTVTVTRTSVRCAPAASSSAARSISSRGAARGEQGARAGAGAALHVACGGRRRRGRRGPRRAAAVARGGLPAAASACARAASAASSVAWYWSSARSACSRALSTPACAGPASAVELTDPGGDGVGLRLGAGDLAVAGCAGGRLRDAGHEADQEGSGDGRAAGAQRSAVPRRAGLAVRGTAVHVATSSDFSTTGTRRGAVERAIGRSDDVVEGRLTPKGGTPRPGEAPVRQFTWRSEPSQNDSRSLNFWILPVAVRASSSRNSTRLGIL